MSLVNIEQPSWKRKNVKGKLRYLSMTHIVNKNDLFLWNALYSVQFVVVAVFETNMLNTQQFLNKILFKRITSGGISFPILVWGLVKVPYADNLFFFNNLRTVCRRTLQRSILENSFSEISFHWLIQVTD